MKGQYLIRVIYPASGEGNDEDFSWEDDDDESITPSESAIQHNKEASASLVAKGLSEADNASRDTLQPSASGATPASYPESLVTSPSNTSPRESSDGYDVVSASNSSDAKSKSTTSEAKNVKDTKAKPTAEVEKKEEDDADSDWE